ncbi:MAG: DUF3179 domain-containing protein [Pseudomonadota bacterium]
MITATVGRAPFFCLLSLVGLTLLYIVSAATHAANPGLAQEPEFVSAQPDAAAAQLGEDFFIDLLTLSDPQAIKAAFATIEQQWDSSYIPILIEVSIFAGSDYTSDSVFATLAKMTGKGFGPHTRVWQDWLWNRPEIRSPSYAEFKADLYRQIDPRFETYFRGRGDDARIRFDEIQWGGVAQDGIPPLRSPEMISVEEAAYLDDDNIVFGIEINGDARAYPKRILAWHEMFTDTIGGVDIAGVYCTLCGTVIPYETSVDGQNFQLGTSGFLYRSNKLMYDQETQSLWNTIRGEPVVGPLADSGVRLPFTSVVTTTWGEWKTRHPETTVLSLNTGHRRDYGEGAAYRDYFATDRLMFQTPFHDDRLANKQEVLALRFMASPKEQLAIDTAFLVDNPLYVDRVGNQSVLVLTDATGANRVYDPKDVKFESYDGDSALVDSRGIAWQLEEEQLRSADEQSLPRLPYHRAFWFGWYATFPETRLVK